MNAYKLADELKKCIDNGSTDLVCVFDAANMLQQQVDHINDLDILLDKKYAIIKQQADRIAELEKDLEGCEYFLKAQTKPCEPLCKPSVCDCFKKASEK